MADLVGPAVYNEPEELIDIVRIKLVRVGGSAVVGDWQAADMLLSRWVAHQKDECKLQFELVFKDGNSLVGRYSYDPKKKSRPLLSKYIKRVFEQLLVDLGPQPMVDCSFKNVPTNLHRYAISRS